jgi:hypothetical protein
MGSEVRATPVVCDMKGIGQQRDARTPCAIGAVARGAQVRGEKEGGDKSCGARLDIEKQHLTSSCALTTADTNSFISLSRLASSASARRTHE